MRLAILTNDYPPKPGGIQQYLGSLVDAFPGEVLVLAPGDGPAATGRGESIVRRHHRSFMWPTASVADWAASEMRAFSPDAVLMGAPHPLPALTDGLRRRLDVPIGVLAHGAEVTLPAAVPVARSMLRRLLRTADVRFAVSRYTAERVGRLARQEVVYVGAGVDLARFESAPPAGGGSPLVGCISRFVPRKGQQRLIDAVARVRAGGVDCGLLLVGKGRTEQALRRQAMRRGVPVRFEVDVPWGRLPGLYAEMDVFCMPCRSRWGGLEVEGLGLVYLEAAAAGRPVIAGDSGGAPETVDPGLTGYVVHDIDGIVEALDILLGDSDRRRRMGEAARRRVEAEFTWDRVAARIMEGFRAV